ncbi:helix-turn-helix domain-containing protein [Azospirillum doebereinerae]|nr:helix-turn-helix transcriptional regulator [Azospirillum doebereinerae]
MAILALILSSHFMATLALPADGHIGHIYGMPNRIAEWRKAKRLSYKGLSDLVGCDPKTIERLEKGYRRLTVDWMARVASALGVEPKDLLPQGEGSKGHSNNQSPNLTRSRSKDLLIDLIDTMTEEEAQKALQIINLAKEFNRTKDAGRDGGDDSEGNISRLAG